MFALQITRTTEKLEFDDAKDICKTLVEFHDPTVKALLATFLTGFLVKVSNKYNFIHAGLFHQSPIQETIGLVLLTLPLSNCISWNG